MTRLRKTQSPYGVEEWGAGYFAINMRGEMAISPFVDDRQVSLVQVVKQCAEQGLTPPLLIRFPQILQSQLRLLYGCFDAAMDESGYEGHYRSVFPLKVNPNRAVVEGLAAAGRPGAFGLEVGSKGELAIALAQQLPPDSWICINGFKDEQMVRMAVAASGGPTQIVLVLERLAELQVLLEEIPREGPAPLLGLRCRLHSRGSGKWEASSGETSKFGLSAAALLAAADTFDAAGLLPRLQVLHYHIGSQITSVRRIKDAVKEAARVYAKLHTRGVPLTTLNVGGGLGVDYDGSRTPSDSSVNYSFQEFANNVVYTVREVCLEENVPLPHLVSESGRALVAHHTLLITNCESRESDTPVDYLPSPDPAIEDLLSSGGNPTDEDMPTQLAALDEIAREISVKNFREYYHDALEVRTEILTLFDLGFVSLEYKARAEQLFYQVCRQALRHARQTRYISDEFRSLEKAFREKYVGNFSVFYSAPDSWAIGQLFPVLPIHRHNETPTQQGILVDLTCDSDGVIDTFVDVRDVKETLELHAGNNEQPYLLAICLLGAYQEVMGIHHNLFGQPPEVAVYFEEGTTRIDVLAKGESIAQVARLAGYSPEELTERFLEHQQVMEESEVGAAGHDERTAASEVGLQKRTAADLYKKLWTASSYMDGDPQDYRRLT